MSTPNEVLAKVIRLAADVGASAVEGNPPDPASLVRQLLGVGLDLMPVEDLRQHLDAEAVARAEAIADEVQRRKRDGEL